MNKNILLIAIIMMVHSFCIAQQSSISLSSFYWLVGTWENMDMKTGQSATETWSKDQSGSLSGIGCTLSGVDTVFIEKLKIVEKDGHCYYVADVSHNAAPVYFKMTSATTTNFVCENPEHDFPQKISYQLDGDMISAVISAGDKEIPFRFRRKK